MAATFALRILEKYLWRKGGSEREQYKYFPWIQTSREPNKMVWLTITNIPVTTLLKECFFSLYTNFYVTLWVLLCIEKMYLQYARYERINLNILFLQFWETKKSAFFSTITATILSETYSSINLRKVCSLKTIICFTWEYWLKNERY